MKLLRLKKSPCVCSHFFFLFYILFASNIFFSTQRNHFNFVHVLPVDFLFQAGVPILQIPSGIGCYISLSPLPCFLEVYTLPKVITANDLQTGEHPKSPSGTLWCDSCSRTLWGIRLKFFTCLLSLLCPSLLSCFLHSLPPQSTVSRQH